MTGEAGAGVVAGLLPPSRSLITVVPTSAGCEIALIGGLRWLSVSAQPDDSDEIDVNPLFVRLGDDTNEGPLNFDVTGDIAVVGGGAFYRIAEWDLDRHGEEPSRKAWIEPLAGLRYTYMRVDMDIEGRSLGKPKGIDRRNRAIKLLQDWAAANGRTVQIQYTLPTAADGPDADSLAVLENAVENGVRIDVVNPMVFDYYDHETTEMGAAAISASQGLHAQLTTLYPDASDAQSCCATSGGRTVMSSGPANGVWLTCTTRRSGLSVRSCPGTSASWKSCTSTTSCSPARSATSFVNAALIATNASHESRKRMSNRGRRTRSNMP